MIKKLFMLVLLLFSVQACAVNDSAVENTADVVEVSMLKFKFVPEVLEIKAGQTVRWVNREKRQYHNVWFNQSGEPEPDYIFPDETYEKSFDKPGEYDYICGPHPKMVGKIVVK